ncbi:MAG: DUF4214 domain-containing protein [Pyrinomonadaceae bacterium]
MRKFTLAVLVLTFIAANAMGQTQQSAPTLRVVTDDPNLPSDLFYGSVRVKPLRLRPGTNQRITIDDGDFFVQQHYVDFLSRFPDAGGMNYWTNSITSCNGDAKCVDEARVSVSAAFFLSQEFQESGYFIYRFYKGTLERMPSYAEFTPDRRQVVGGTNLETSRANFANAFVQRAEFLQKFPASLAPEAFVNQLTDTIKATTKGAVDLSAQRAALLSTLQASGRAAAVRQAIESKAFSDAEFNNAFVEMQYFGYLRRDPEPAGYAFWIDILNNRVPNNYRSMVKAFVTAQEYKDRF